MATGYWRGADNANWSTGTNWFDSITGPTTLTDATVPGAGNSAFFNANGTTTARTVYLNAPAGRSIGTFWMNGNAQGDITLRGGVSGGETTQTLTLGGIDMSGTSANSVWASSVSVALANNQAWSIGSGRAILVSGVISGAFKLTSSNSGVIILGNANTYSGGTDISAGTVRVGNNQALGTGAGSTVTMTGGQLSSSSTTGYTLANAFSLNAAGGSVTLTDSVNTGTLTLTGNMNVASATSTTFTSNNNIVDLQGSLTGSGALTHTTGQWWFNKTTGNTYNGAVTINGGIFYLGRDTTLPNQLGGGTPLATIAITTGSLFFGGTSAYQVDNTITSPVNANSILYGRTRNAATGLTFTGLSGFQGSLRVYASAFDGAISTQTVTLTAFPTNAANLRYQQSNTVNMTQTFRYTGTANVSSASSIVMTADTNTLDAVWYHAPSNGTATMTMSGLVSSNTLRTHSFDVRNDSSGLLTLSGGIDQQNTGVMSLKKSGTGPATLSGANTYKGTVSVSAGTLNANSATALGAASSTAAISVTSGATLSLGGASNVTYSSRTVALAGTGVSNAGALVVANAVTNTFSGITLTAGTLIRGTESGTLTAPITTGDFVLTFTVADTKTLTFPSVIGASGTTVATNTLSGDTGTLVLSAQSLYTGPTTVNRGTVRVGASSVGSPGSVTSGPLGRGQITWNGGALDASTTATLGNNVVLGGNVSFGGTAALTLAGTVSLDTSRTITTNGSGGALTLSGVVSGTGFRLTKAGINTLVLSNASNSYSGGTTINDGTLSISDNGNLGASGAEVVIDGGQLTATASFSITNRTIKLGPTAGSFTFGIINVSSGQTLVCFASLQNNGSGSGRLYKDGTGQLDVRGNFNYYSNGTDVYAGTLRAAGPQPLGTGRVFLYAGSTLQLASAAGPGTINLTIAALTNSAGGTIKIGG